MDGSTPVRAWKIHAAVIGVLAVIVAVLAFWLATLDRSDDRLGLGGVFALLLGVAVAAYAVVSTAVVAAFVRKPIHIATAHVASIGLTLLLGYAACAR